MKHSTIKKNFTIAVVAALALGIAPLAKADDKGCSNATLKGTFAFTYTGVGIAPEVEGPAAEVGTQTFDGNGGTSATAMLSAHGNLFQLTETGTYTVNPDCTGTFAVLVSPFGVTFHVFFVIDDGGNGLQALEAEKAFVVTRVYRRLFPGRAI